MTAWSGTCPSCGRTTKNACKVRGPKTISEPAGDCIVRIRPDDHWRCVACVREVLDHGGEVKLIGYATQHGERP